MSIGLDEIADDYFTCAETPVWFSADFKLEQLPICNSCTVRIIADLPGPGKLTESPDGFLLDENPVAVFHINGHEHTLLESRLLIPGCHRLPGRTEPESMELQFYFRSIKKLDQFQCLVVPVMKESVGNSYFTTLGLGVTANRPMLTSLISSESEIYQYMGADIRGRTREFPRPSHRCDPVLSKVTYNVLTSPASIGVKDYDRILKLYRSKKVVGPPKPIAQIPPQRILELVTRIKDIKIGNPRSHAKSSTLRSSDGSYPVKALQCRRINTTNDIVGDRIYVGGKNVPATSLQTELEQASDLSTFNDALEKSIVKPADIENTLSIVLGIVFGVIICATIAYYCLKHTYSNYIPVVQDLYKQPFKPAIDASIKLPSLPAVFCGSK